MRARSVVAILVAGLMAAAPACSSDEGGGPRAVERETKGDVKSKPSPTRDRPAARERGRTRPGPAELTITALGADRARARRAVADLKNLGFWRRLTKPVAAVRISSRAGTSSIPEDGHLADAQRNVQLGRHPGYVCDVMIYSTALEEDVDRQESYYAQGRLLAPPPDLREFWAVILAHEVAHCSPRGQRGEAYSTRWEARVLEAYDKGRIGSP